MILPEIVDDEKLDLFHWSKFVSTLNTASSAADQIIRAFDQVSSMAHEKSERMAALREELAALCAEVAAVDLQLSKKIRATLVQYHLVEEEK